MAGTFAAKYREIAPHMETKYQGQPGAWWLIEQDRQPHNVILGFGANKSIEELQKLLKGFSYAGAHRGGWDPAQRVKDMDQDGVAGDVLYTTLGFRMFWIKDAGFQRACFQVYNDWLAEFCSLFAQAAQRVGADIALRSQASCGRSERNVQKKVWPARWCGLRRRKSCRFTRNLRPFWAAAQELTMPLSLHEFAGFQWVDWDSNSKKRTIAAGDQFS